MRQSVLGALGALVGAAILLRFLLSTDPVGDSGAYAAGQYAAIAVGALLLIVGGRALVMGLRERAEAGSPSGRGGKGRGGRAVVGLDIDSAFVAAVQTDEGAVVRAVSAELPPGIVHEGEVVDAAALSESLKQFFRENGLPRRVRLGVSNQQIVVRTLEVPRLDDPKALDAAIRFQAADTIAMPLEEAVLDHHIVGEAMNADGRPMLRAVVVAARASMVDRFIEAARGAGLRPEGIDLNAFALVRALTTRSAPEDGAKVLCHLGGTTNLAIALAHTCLFTRPLATSVEEEGDHVGPALAEEIRMSIDFYASQPDAPMVESVRLSGPGARRPGLAEELESMVGLPVVVDEPLGGLAVDAMPEREDAHRHTVAAGLALGAAA
jgi:Tfp pilus assembly PilM family ATPase